MRATPGPTSTWRLWTQVRTASTTAGAYSFETLPEPEAEAAAFHELAHIYLGHDANPRLTLIPRGARERGPWELEADALAAAMVEDGDQRVTDLAASLDYLAADAAQYVD